MIKKNLWNKYFLGETAPFYSITYLKQDNIRR